MTQVDLSWTNVLAFWGAFLSTIILVWDVYKWKTSGERLRLTISPHMLILNDPRYKNKDPHISFRVENFGDRATTITNLSMCYYTDFFKMAIRKPSQSMIVRPITFGHDLPYKLESGTYWTGLALQTDDIVNMADKGLLIAEIYHSNKKKSIKKKITIREKLK